MKKILSFFIFLILTTSVWSFFNDTASLVEPNRMEANLSLSPLSQPGIVSYIRGGFGIYDWGASYIDIGYGSDYNGQYGVYSKLFFKILITEFFGGTDHVAIALGPQYHNCFGVYSSLILSTPYKNLEFYTGLDDVINFKQKIEIPFSFLIGIKMKNLLNFIKFDNIIPSGTFEMNVPLTDYADYVFSLTVQYRLNYKILKNKD